MLFLTRVGLYFKEKAKAMKSKTATLSRFTACPKISLSSCKVKFKSTKSKKTLLLSPCVSILQIFVWQLRKKLAFLFLFTLRFFVNEAILLGLTVQNSTKKGVSRNSYNILKGACAVQWRIALTQSLDFRHNNSLFSLAKIKWKHM